jgi:aldehyde:ferredoxin oxidoreductase
MIEKIFGYAGQILRIDLSKKKILKEPLRKDFIKKYIGCTGYAAAILWYELKPKIDPLSPENKIIFSTGPLTGTLCPCSGSYEICFKSPLTNAFGESRSGGIFGPKMKYAGFDHIIIEGKSDKPIYIWIYNGEVEIKDAQHLYGKTVHETTEIILEEVKDSQASIACIGPAGEKMVRFASIMNDRDRAAGRSGGGAVMGSKNLKAIAVNGEKDIEIANPEKFYEFVTEAEKALLKKTALRRFGTINAITVLNAMGALPTKYGYTGFFEKAEDVSTERLSNKYLIKRRACFACPIGCGRYSEVKHGIWATPPHEGPEFETADMLGPWMCISNLEAIIKANYLCNNYGLDTISTGNVIAFAIECYEKGWIKEDLIKGIKLEWDNPENMIKLISLIAKREGIGDLLAEGVMRAAEKIGHGAPELALHTKGLEMPAHDPRGETKIMAIKYAVEYRGGCHVHSGFPGLYDRSPESLNDYGLKQFGLPWPPKNKFIEEGKGIAYKFFAIFGQIPEIMGMCQFASMGSEGNMITAKDYANIYSSLTGIEMNEYDLMKIAERVYNLKRCFNIREGFTRKDDKLPKRMHEPIATGPARGEYVKNLDLMLNEFYEAMGWDIKTGIPTFKKLKELELEDIAEELKKI